MALKGVTKHRKVSNLEFDNVNYTTPFESLCYHETRRA